MDKVYVVCEDKTSEYGHIPQGSGITSWNGLTEPKLGPGWNKSSSIGNPTNMEFPMKPRFDPITPQFYPAPKVFAQTHPNNIVCLCKDLDTANHYLNGYPNRYILGPYKIM